MNCRSSPEDHARTSMCVCVGVCVKIILYIDKIVIKICHKKSGVHTDNHLVALSDGFKSSYLTQIICT